MKCVPVEWGSDASVEQESIRAIVEGYAEGRIELGKIAPRTSPSQTRNAPHFSQMTAFLENAVKTHPYTTTQLMEFTTTSAWTIVVESISRL